MSYVVKDCFSDVEATRTQCVSEETQESVEIAKLVIKFVQRLVYLLGFLSQEKLFESSC